MKKVIVAILAVLYMTASVGATIHIHYCMGKMADWGFSHNKSKHCSKCGMEQTEKKDNGCCKDVEKFFKNNADQKTVESVSYPAPLISAALPASFIEITVNNFPALSDENPVSHAPPPGNGVAVYIRNCVFLI